MEMERLEQELRDFFAVEVNQTEPPTEWWNNIITGLEDRKRDQGSVSRDSGRYW